MKHILIGLSIMFLMSCKSSGQVVLIKSDGGLISEDDLKKSSLRARPPLIAVMNKDTIDLSIDLSKLPDTPPDQTYPNFQRATATEGQTFFPFIIPKIYFVVKNKVIMDFIDDYTVSNSGITFLTPSKIGDKIKIINMQPK